MSRTLEGDDLMGELMHSEGILGAFFSVLWYKGLGKRMHQLVGVNIPDTIIYLYSKPLHWFFSSKTGEIKKKSRGRLNSKYIEEKFLKNGTSVSCIKACYLIAVPSETPSEAKAKVTYTFGSDLRKFLQEDKPNGVLQLFFDPKAEAARDGTATHNSLIQTTWSPGCFFIEKRVNKHRLDQHKIPIETRAATFDDYQNTETVPLVSDSVAGSFQKVCQLIAEHIRIVFRFKLASLVLNFKIDKNDTIWLLWCSSIRIVSEDKPSKGLSSGALQPSRYTRSDSLKKPAKLRKTPMTLEDALDEKKKCELCLLVLTRIDLCQVHVKSVVTALSNFECMNEDTVPPAILLLYPEMTLESYNELKADPNFPNTPVTVCNTCLQGLVKSASNIDPSRPRKQSRICKMLEANRTAGAVSHNPSPSTFKVNTPFKGTVTKVSSSKNLPSLQKSSVLEFYSYNRTGQANRIGYAACDEPQQQVANYLTANTLTYSLKGSLQEITSKLDAGAVGRAERPPSRSWSEEAPTPQHTPR